MFLLIWRFVASVAWLDFVCVLRALRATSFGMDGGRLYQAGVMVERCSRDWEAASVNGEDGFNAESAESAEDVSFLPDIFAATGAQSPDHAPRRLSQPRRAG